MGLCFQCLHCMVHKGPVSAKLLNTGLFEIIFPNCYTQLLNETWVPPSASVATYTLSGCFLFYYSPKCLFLKVTYKFSKPIYIELYLLASGVNTPLNYMLLKPQFNSRFPLV